MYSGSYFKNDTFKHNMKVCNILKAQFDYCMTYNELKFVVHIEYTFLKRRYLTSLCVRLFVISNVCLANNNSIALIRTNCVHGINLLL